MGAFWISRIELIAMLGEQVGYKSGLALDRSEITNHLPDYEQYLSGDDDEDLRVRLEVYEYMIAKVLYCLGNIPTPEPMFPAISLFHKYKHDSKKNALREGVMKLFFEMYPTALAEAEQTGGPIDLTNYCLEAHRSLGSEGGG